MNDHSLTGQVLFDLKVLHREITDKRQADRVKAVILLGSGWTPSQVAQVLLIDRTTVRRYYRAFKKGGVTRLLETNYIRHRGHLSLEQEQELDTYFTRTPSHHRQIGCGVCPRTLGGLTIAKAA